MLICVRQQVISITHSLSRIRTLLLLRSTWGDIRDATCHMIDGINDFNEKPLVSTWSELEWHKREQDAEMQTSGSQEMIRTWFSRLWVGSICGLTGDIWNLWDRLWGQLVKALTFRGRYFLNLIGLRIILNKLKTINCLGRKRLGTYHGCKPAKHVHCFRRKWG